MVTIQSPLTKFVWYAAPLTLSTAFANKARIKLLRVLPGNSGATERSFDPARGTTNSLTVLNTGDLVTLQALGITAGTTSTYFTLDNGTAPTGSTTPPAPLTDTIEIDGSNASEAIFPASDQVIQLSRAAQVVSSFSSGSGTIQYSADNGANWASFSPTVATSIAAGAAFILRVLNPNQTSFAATLVLTYSS